MKLQILGWDIDRASVSKIEAQLVWVGDFQMFYLAAALGVDIKQLFPAFIPGVRLHDNILKLRGEIVRGGVSHRANMILENEN